MARRSDYPFRKSDLKFGTNLIASLFSVPISLGMAAIFDGIGSISKHSSGKSSSEAERVIIHIRGYSCCYTIIPWYLLGDIIGRV